MSAALSLQPAFYEALKRLTLELAGVRLGTDHAFLVETRLASLARLEGFETLDAMINELFKTGQTRLAVRVVSALVERDTHFFRDPDSLDRLFDGALHDLARKRGGGTIKVLCHGCGSGQDVYSVAIKAANLKTDPAHPLSHIDLRVTGVDYPSQALERAEIGQYSHFDVQRGLSIRDLLQYFTPLDDTNNGGSGGDWVINPEIKAMTEFKGLHLLSGMDSLDQYHAISFRGAMSHYSATARLRIMRSLSALLRPHGYLILGSDDQAGQALFGLTPVKGQKNLFQKSGAAPAVPDDISASPAPARAASAAPLATPYVPPTSHQRRG